MLSSFQKCYSRRWIFGVVLFLFCFVLGFMRMNRQMQAVEFAFGSEETTYRMFLVEEPQIKERNVFCRVLLTERIDSSYRKTTLNHKAIVYLSRDSLSECLGCGDELIAYTGFLLLPIMGIRMSLTMPVFFFGIRLVPLEMFIRVSGEEFHKMLSIRFGKRHLIAESGYWPFIVIWDSKEMILRYFLPLPWGIKRG